MTLLSGPRLVLTVSALTLLSVVVATLYAGGYVAGLPLVMWPTAYLAFAFFWMAFTASSLQRLKPTAYSRWATKNRRYIGLSFASVHFIHAALVLSNLSLTEESRPIPILLAGTLAYVFIALMALTSNNASVKKLGAKNWRKLHLIGSWYVWLLFMSGAPDILNGNIGRALMTGFGLIALVLRIRAYRLKKAKQAASLQSAA